MRLLVLVACVLLTSLAARAEERPTQPARTERAGRAWRVERLRLIPIDVHRHEGRSLAHLFERPEAFGSDSVLRTDEMIHRAENTLISAVENAQHLGSPYRTWLWIAPMSGGSDVYGAVVRIDYR